MSVVGIGTDIVDIRRIAKMSGNAQQRLAKRILTDKEYQHYLTLKQPERFLAKRWAGKEAAAKALALGIFHFQMKLNMLLPLLCYQNRYRPESNFSKYLLYLIINLVLAIINVLYLNYAD